ncbi:hypothetical protein FRC03_004952 [Tulasnella sp. 419]|nr:hypothetical protein FRC03_004952 [Tulasnella sp. 419]
MSYANVASHHTDDSKVNVVPQDFKAHPATVTSEKPSHTPEPYPEPLRTSGGSGGAHSTRADASRQWDKSKDKIKKEFHKAEEEGSEFWEETKRVILQPGVMGGLIGIANIGIIGTVGYQFYAKPHLRSDTRALTTTAISALALFGTEGLFADAYRKTAAGQQEERRAKEEGAIVYRRTKEIVLRPGVFGGLMGLVNVGVLGTVGYYGYVNWDKPVWDRRTVSAVTVGLIAFFSGEGYLAEQYKEKEYPKRR